MAELIEWRCHVNRIFILQIWSATPIQDMNTSTPMYKKVKKLAALHLFVETLPRYKAISTGNRNIEFYSETTCSNCILSSITRMPDRTQITVFFLTPLIFRYHLPLKRTSTAICFWFLNFDLEYLRRVQSYELLHTKMPLIKLLVGTTGCMATNRDLFRRTVLQKYGRVNNCSWDCVL